MSSQRNRRLLLLGGVLLAAIVVVVVAIAVSQGGAEDEEEPPAGGGRPQATQTEEVERQFAGIPQDEVALGDPDAPATLIEFADLQCPFCAQFAVEALPSVVDRFVRDGRLRLELRLLAFLGPDSERGAEVAAVSVTAAWLSGVSFSHDGRSLLLVARERLLSWRCDTCVWCVHRRRGTGERES